MGNCVCIHTIEESNLNKQRVEGVKKGKEKGLNSISHNGVQKQTVEEKENDIDHEVPHSTTVSQPVLVTLVEDDSAPAETPESSNLKQFTYLELKLATMNFSEKHFIGEGGFGQVYRGWAFDGEDCVPVAIKKLNPKGFQGYPEWLTEVVILSRLCHPNIVKLVGHCSQEQEYYLVYEYMSKGSLDNYLFCRDNELLGWDRRLNIALGVARALAFLHCQDPPVIYRDIKSSNVLLNSEFDPKLSDFGLAKDGPTGLLTHVSTRVYGTYGYVAPEYYQTGHLRVTDDVYGFGVLLLELVCGRPAVDSSLQVKERNLVQWVRPHLRKKLFYEVVDERVRNQCSKRSLFVFFTLADHCLAESYRRPDMSDVVNVLKMLVGGPEFGRQQKKTSQGE